MCVRLSVSELGRSSTLYIVIYHSSQTRAHTELPSCELVFTTKLSSLQVQERGYKLRCYKLITPRACRLKKRRRKEEIFIFQNQIKRGKKKMLHEKESLTAFPPPNLSDF